MPTATELVAQLTDAIQVLQSENKSLKQEVFSAIQAKRTAIEDAVQWADRAKKAEAELAKHTRLNDGYVLAAEYRDKLESALAAFVAIKEAFAPVAPWYEAQGGEQSPRTLAEMLTDAVHDLIEDRKGSLKAARMESELDEALAELESIKRRTMEANEQQSAAWRQEINNEIDRRKKAEAETKLLRMAVKFYTGCDDTP